MSSEHLLAAQDRFRADKVRLGFRYSFSLVRSRVSIPPHSSLPMAIFLWLPMALSLALTHTHCLVRSRLSIPRHATKTLITVGVRVAVVVTVTVTVTVREWA